MRPILNSWLGLAGDLFWVLCLDLPRVGLDQLEPSKGGGGRGPLAFTDGAWCARGRIHCLGSRFPEGPLGRARINITAFLVIYSQIMIAIVIRRASIIRCFLSSCNLTLPCRHEVRWRSRGGREAQRDASVSGFLVFFCVFCFAASLSTRWRGAPVWPLPPQVQNAT